MSCRTRPELTEGRIEQIRSIIRQNPDWNRTRISNQICMLWEWQSPNGHMKDVSCRDMLRALDKAGKIKLPAAQKPSRAKGAPDIVKHMEHDRTPFRATLAELRPLRVSIASAGEELAQFKSMLSQHHYLGFDRSIGENMKYVVYSRDGKLLSCLMFGSAAWSCRDRDRFIGWDREEKLRSLSMMTNNSRFLIPEWISAPHLASHVLSLISRRIAGDWVHKYGHPVYCLETCVETGRFRGICYRAANWVKVGATTGRGRDGGHQNAILPRKDVYLYPLAPNFRRLLSGKNAEAPNGGLDEAGAQ